MRIPLTRDRLSRQRWIAVLKSQSWLHQAYAALVLGLAMFIALTSLFLATNRHFILESTLTFTLPDQDTISTSDFHQQVVSELKDLTSTDWLIELHRRAQIQNSPAGSVSNESLTSSFDKIGEQHSDNIRRNMAFSVRRDPHSQSVRLEMRVIKSPVFGESELRELTAELNRRAQRIVAPASSLPSQLAGEGSTWHSWEIVLERAQSLAMYIESAAQQLTGSDSTDFKSTPSARPADPGIHAPINTFQSASYSKSLTTSGPSFSGNELADSAHQLVDSLAMLTELLAGQSEIRFPGDSAAPATDERTSIRNLKQETSGRFRCQPMGPLGSRYYALFSALLSFGLGAFVVLKSPASTGRRGFSSIAEIEHALGSPVLAVIPDSPPPAGTNNGFRNSRILKLSEMLILATFMAVICLAWLRPEFGSELFTDPLQALCRLMCSLRG
ncbi:MAG TPA: hypothetical protein PKD54_12030 [Pirellulaceae bacterium]|nr:hypothetical protein [Pirellulaceae bacterium]